MKPSLLRWVLVLEPKSEVIDLNHYVIKAPFKSI